MRFSPLILFLLCALLFPAPIRAQEKDGALELYYSANALYNRKLYSLAMEEYDAFLKNYPDHEKSPQASMGLALCLYSLQNHKKAEPVFARLTKERDLENQQEIHNLWGQCLLELSRMDEAERAFAWSAENGNDAEQKAHAQVGRIEAQYRQSKWAEVIRNADRFLKENRDAAHVQRVKFQGAVARFESGRFEQARDQLEALYNASERTPFMQHVTFLLAESLRELGNNPEALSYYATAAKMEGAFTAEARFRMGFVRFKDRDYTAAARDFLHLIENHGAAPTAPQARLYLGRCLLERCNHTEAEQLFESFEPDAQEYAAARLWLARSHARQNRHEDAERVLHRALDRIGKNPLRADLQFELASARMEQGKFDEAAKGFRDLYRAAPDSPTAPDALWLEAYSLHKGGKFQASLKRCDEYLKEHGDSERSGEVFFLKAENLFLMDRLADAESIYRDFLERHEDHFYRDSALFRTAQVKYKQKEWQEGLIAMKPLLREPPEGAFFSQLFYIQGDCYFNCKLWDHAITAFGLFVGTHPGEANADAAAFKAALCMEYKGDKERAMATLDSFIEHFEESPYRSHACIQRGRLHYEKGNYGEARRSFDQAVKIDGSPHALYYLAYVAMAEEKHDEAARHFNALAAENPDHELAADAGLQQGIIEIRRESYSQGQKLIRRFLNAHPDHVKADQAYFYMGMAFSRQEQWEEAGEYFQNVYERFPSSTMRDRALYELAWCEKGRKRNEQAASHYEVLLREFPDSPLQPEAVFELAELEYEGGNYDRAAARLNSIIDEPATNDLRERAIYRLGWNLFAKGDMADAARAFETLLNDYPDTAKASVALYQAGEARLKVKEFEEAYRHFKRLTERKDDAYREQSLLRLGECAALTQRWQESENVYRRFEREKPDSAFLNRALFGQGWALENRGKYRDAIKAYEKVLARGGADETTARSQFQIGECHFSLEDYNEAVKALIKVEVMYAYPQWSAKALLETARALALPGNTEEAKARYREVIAKYPDSDAATVAKEQLNSL